MTWRTQDGYQEAVATDSNVAKNSWKTCGHTILKGDTIGKKRSPFHSGRFDTVCSECWAKMISEK